MPLIHVIQPEDAEGKLKKIYEDLSKSRGKVAEVHKIQSLNPESIIRHMDLYMTLMFGKSPLKRYQREMIAVVVSRANDCGYCQRHHAEAINFYWKDEARTERLKQDYRSVDLDAMDIALCDYAELVTHSPASDDISKKIDVMRTVGLQDRAVLDATLIVAYFNFVNRIVLALDVPLENDPGGYKYD